MAKADKKGSRKNAGLRGKMPKRIAGTKVPKALRRSGAQALKWAASPAGREILGGLLVAAAAALAGSRKTREAMRDGAKDAASGATRVGHVIAGAAAEVVRRTVGGDREGTTETASPRTRGAKRGRNRPGAPGLAH